MERCEYYGEECLCQNCTFREECPNLDGCDNCSNADLQTDNCEDYEEV